MWLLMAGTPALAQVDASEESDEEVEQSADAVFEAGIRAMERGDWLAGEVLFRQAYDAEPSERFRLNLAEALYHQDRLLAAKVEAEGVLHGSDLLLQDAARGLLERIEGRLAVIRVVPRGLAATRAVVQIDGRPVDPFVSTAVDPGEHTVALFDGDRHLSEKTISLSRGQEEEVVMEVDLSPRAVAAASGDDPVLLGGPDARARRRRRLGFGISAAVLVVAVAVGLGVGLGRDPSAPTGDTDPIILGAP